MLFEKISVVNERFEIEHDRYVGIRDGRIIYIGAWRP